MTRALFVVSCVLVAGCSVSFSVTEKPFRCSVDGGEDQCPGRGDGGQWRCNFTWGHCFDPDAGLATPCSSDDECGGGWRCSTDRTCVNPAGDRQPTTLPAVPPATLVHPLFIPSGELRAAERVTLIGDRSTTNAASIAWRDDAGVVSWLLYEDETIGDETFTSYRFLQAPTLASGPFEPMAILRANGSVTHAMWSLNASGRLRAVTTELTGPLDFVADAGPSAVGAITRLSTLRPTWLPSPGVRSVTSFLAAWAASGAVEFRAGFNGSVAYTPSAITGAENVAMAGVDFGCAGQPAAVVFSGPGGLHAAPYVPMTASFADGGRDLGLGAAGQVRFAPFDGVMYAAWQSGDEILLTRAASLCATAPAPLRVSTCEAGFRLVDFGVVNTGDQVLPARECASADGGEHVVVTGDSQRPLPAPRRILARSSESFSFYRFGLVTHGAPTRLDQVPLTLPLPPETVFREGSELELWTRSARFVETDAGLLAVKRSANPENVVAAAVSLEGARALVWRDGTVGYRSWNDAGSEVVDVLAYPAQAWFDPSVQVQAQAVALADGGTMVALSHDDWIDVAEISSDQAELVPRLRPLPGFPVTSLALAPSTDGGAASGFAVAGSDLFALTAATSRKWDAAKVSLGSAQPVHVYFDRGLPRVITDDGRIIGLATRVALVGPTPEPVIAATAACDAPFALTTEGVYTLVGADGGVAWSRVKLPKLSTDQRAWDFSTARVFSLDGEIVLVSREGITWTLKVCE